ncbi:MAG: hypothetical protein P3W95_008910, partial [Tepidimonas taiwanensis]|nr:hypothetical protein [Tepidimonas taiwanensis]
MVTADATAAPRSADDAPDALQARSDAFARPGPGPAGSLLHPNVGEAVLPRGGRVWLGSVIQLLEPLGVNERLVRTAVYRLVQDGWLTTEARGRRTENLLTAAGRARAAEAARQNNSPRAPRWGQHWRLLLTTGGLAARERER